MAGYAPQQERFQSRPGKFDQTSSHERDTAFSNIFGASPPGPGRSQVITSPQAPMPTERAQTMGARPSDMYQRTVPGRPPQAPYQQGYPVPPMANGYHQPKGQMPPSFPSYGQPRNLPPPLHNDRRPYAPQRIDPQTHLPQQQARRPVPDGLQQTYNAPALNSAANRTQSLATNPRPPPFQGPIGNQSMTSAGAFRQPAYSNISRTTAQGRIVPERHDERSMSMTSFSRDGDYSQTMSGRVVPSRRRESASTQDLSNHQPQPSMDSYGSAPPPTNRRTSSQDSQQSQRTMSLASTALPSERVNSLASSIQRPAPASGASSISSQKTEQKRRRTPLVYPAMLSKVADAFRERIGLSDKEKDGLVYKNAFSGSEAVDLIAYIMQTTDRNLALLLGRSLDAQKFFHDVTYDHRLRDAPSEIYQLKETLAEDGTDVNGVFTLTTECYSPTCTPDRLCYSIACPKRVDQQKRLNMRAQPGLRRETSRTSLHDEHTDEQKLWINTVSKEVSESVSEREKKRQEIIMEAMYTERDFVKDLEYLRDFWMKPLRSTNPTKPSPIAESRREAFVRTVFSNCQDVYAVNSKLADSLTRRQQQEPVVRNIGDIFLDYVPRFGPFIKYGASQMFAKYEYEREKSTNPMFAKFADQTERLKESRKLELNGYLTKPTTRLARYPLLLEGVLKYTADDNPDKHDLPRAIAMIRAVLSRVNEESGKAENQFTLLQLNQQLIWRAGEYVDLKLIDGQRQLLYRGILKKNPSDSTGDIQAYLFDNALLFVRAKTVNKREELKVWKKPIPLGLLVMSQSDALSKLNRPPSSLLPGARTHTGSAPRQDTIKQQGYPITFKHLGKGGFEQILYCMSQIQREKWIMNVEAQQKTLRERNNIFKKTVLNEKFFNYSMRINCCVPIDGGRKLVVGTDVGIYVAESRPKDASIKPRRVLDLKNVTQVDVLEQYQILLVLADKTLSSYSMEALDPDETPLAASKRGRRIASANFFKIGVIDGQHLVACVKTTSLSATIKIYKPTDTMANSKKKTGISRMLAGGQEVLKPHKEFYIPTETYSIHFLRKSLCVGCAKGFEIVTLDTLVTQPLLDQADTSLDFVAMKENLRPIHVERLNPNFLLNYSEFSFFVNRHGWRAKPEWKIIWEGNPQAFAMHGPYILAFEPSFIEIRHLDTGILIHILTARNIRMLHSSTREMLYAYEDDSGEDVIASLDFWAQAPQSSASSATLVN